MSCPLSPAQRLYSGEPLARSNSGLWPAFLKNSVVSHDLIDGKGVIISQPGRADTHGKTHQVESKRVVFLGARHKKSFDKSNDVIENKGRKNRPRVFPTMLMKTNRLIIFSTMSMIRNVVSAQNGPPEHP